MEDPRSSLPSRKRIKLDYAKEIKTEEIPLLQTSIWDKILSYVNFTDYLSTINTCPEWNHLLISRKTTELFQMAVPSIMLFLPKKDFLNLRLISRDWKQKCEFVYQNHPCSLAAPTSNIKFPKLSSHGKMLPNLDNGVKLQSLESIKRFTSEMRNDSRNPFPGRCVWLVVTDREDSDSNEDHLDEQGEEIHEEFQQEYWNALNQFLLQFGDYMWYLRLDYFFRFTTNVENRFRNILLQVPNLKTLRLKLGDPNSDCWTDSSEQLNKRAVKFNRASPPPKLESLETFSYISSDENLDYFEDFVNQIVKSYCVEGKLKRLHMPDTSYKPKLFSELKELSAWCLTGIYLS
ncbi:unnamed protein product [Orchesella dallaii]|uniref:F-box domain-containing protein n=1 Tax=Orchesella dallaii TaxID=48710 RepID=A0ABP1RV06_9HEXA